ncbi:hypothetical protein CR155_11000 [Pollutimonas nitritireducens]|uniref:Uncharacterized protein n=1 Tax=Pollutimonas nitritireducens TaxID=2045209 RepID=A0A2N4UG12_9BURK|nr:hypothetical protein CR155_11000 [Pollutimonas nitritireducens]
MRLKLDAKFSHEQIARLDNSPCRLRSHIPISRILPSHRCNNNSNAASVGVVLQTYVAGAHPPPHIGIFNAVLVLLRMTALRTTRLTLWPLVKNIGAASLQMHYLLR